MAGQAGFEPATPGFGVRCSVQLELLTLLGPIDRPDRRAWPPVTARLLLPSNFTLFVYRMAATTRAEFLDRKLVGLALLVLGGRVIAPFATIALKSYQVSHLSFLLLSWR